jgi:hypothetical protein
MNENVKIAEALMKLANELYNDEPVEIVIETENAAFQDGNREYEIARILRKLADDVESGKSVKKLMDINGNSCGIVSGL